MLVKAASAIVAACECHARPVVIAAFVLTMALAAYAGTHLGMDTDLAKLIDRSLPWRQQEIAFDRAFPQFTDLLVVVVDAATPDIADDAAGQLKSALASRPDLFRSVRSPFDGPFFRKSALLLLPADELTTVTNSLIAAQPFLAELSTDPSLRGLFGLFNQALGGVATKEADIATFARLFAVMAETIESILSGAPHPMSWIALLSGRPPGPAERRQIILTQPVLDFGELQPGAKAATAIREIAATLGFGHDSGVRVRLTGPVAISDEEFATIKEGTGIAGAVSVASIVVLLLLGLRSGRMVAASLVTLVVGLVACAAFAAVTVRTLNPISVAFAIMFVGIAVDFSIQFCTRYRAERPAAPDHRTALLATVARIGAPLLVAAIATSIGFLAFIPTSYSGISQLGLIASAGMLIAVFLNFTVLPAILTVLPPRPKGAIADSAVIAPIDRLLVSRRAVVLGAASVLGLVSLAALTQLRFDFNPLHLRDPGTESIATLIDMMSDPESTPNTIDILAGSVVDAQTLAKRLEKLPEVAHAITLRTFVPDDQDEKLATIRDAAFLVGPSLDMKPNRAPPTVAELRTVMAETRDRLQALGALAGDPGRRLADALDGLLARDDATVKAAGRALLAALPARIAMLRDALDAGPIKEASLPADLRRDWVAPDGRARVLVQPTEPGMEDATLRRFAAAVRAVAPEATGPVVVMIESGHTMVRAFAEAGATAVVAIALLLAVVLRRLRDALLVIAPLLLASVVALAACVLIGLQLNYANVIALPLLLGIGVAFNIYFVMNWRAGVANPLQSSTARGVLFSALTTTAAFGGLALSTHPGTAAMGLLLALSLASTLATTFIVLPALLGRPASGDRW